MHRILAALVLLVVASAAQAVDRYTVDPNHTHATFSFRHLGLSTFHGKIPATRGTIELDRVRRTGRIDVTFDPAAVSTAVPAFDEHLRSGDFFEVEKHPTARFTSDSIRFDGDAPAEASGELTIRGIARPVTLKITSFACVGTHPMAKVPACGADARATIRRSEFGLTYGGPAVDDEIELEIEVEAMRAE